MEKIWVDFQNASIDGVRLICSGTIKDIKDNGIILKDGLKLMIWSEDEGDDGKADNLVVEATIKYSDNKHDWVAQFDWNELKNESKL